MRSITLHTCRGICISQNAKHAGKNDCPCKDCPITRICMLFVNKPIDWSEYSVKSIDIDSEAFYKLMKGDQTCQK